MVSVAHTIIKHYPGPRPIAILRFPTEKDLREAHVRRWLPSAATVLVSACSDTAAPSHVDSIGFAAVAAGSAHSCAVSELATVYCWGDNDQGQVGARTGEAVNPVAQQVLLGPIAVASIATGDRISCALLVSGTPLCWGATESSPRALTDAPQLASLSVGDFVCGQRADSVAVCWSDIGAAPRTIDGVKFRQLSVGGFACGIATDGATLCWQAGVETVTPVEGGVAFDAVSVGGAHACGVASTSEVYCWGENDEGQLGDLTTTSRPEPAPVSGSLRFTALATGRSHSCAIATDANLYCWGAAREGRLGYGGPPPDYGIRITSPVRVREGELPEEVVWTGVTGGGAHSCAVAAGGDIYCWGSNISGQVGDGTTEVRPQPVLVGSAERGES